MKSYRDLIVWQKSMSWVTIVYSLTSKIPESEKFGLISQIRRSSVAIPSNIAEGYGRNYKKDGEFNNLMQQMINFIFVELWKNYAGD